MPHTIAVAGKGGVGKTTTCGMLIDYLCKKNKGPVLVVTLICGLWAAPRARAAIASSTAC